MYKIAFNIMKDGNKVSIFIILAIEGNGIVVELYLLYEKNYIF